MRSQRIIRLDKGIFMVLALLPLLLFGCDESSPVPSSVTIAPASATLPVGGTQNFTANLNGRTSAGVNWSVHEGTAGGSITAAGVYTAPNAPGTFHVVATSQADATKQAASTVTVQAGSVQGTIQ